MLKESRNISLLAPARDLQVGKAAIQAGADAVYIGAPEFGARQAAGNSLQDIASLVEYAHLFGHGHRIAVARLPQRLGRG